MFISRGLSTLVALGMAMVFGLPAQAQSALDNVARTEVTGSIKSFVLSAKEAGNVVSDESDTRVFGGRRAQQGSWPWQVSLHDTARASSGNARSQFCGGSIIARQWILTAAHCIQDMEMNITAPSDVLVRTGHVDLQQGEFRRVSVVIPHPNYQPIPRFDNDIALLKLAEPIGNSSGPVGAIPVLQDGSQMRPGPAVSIGWGLMEDGNYPDFLMEAEIDVVPNDTCNKGFAEQTRQELAGLLVSLGTGVEIPQNKLEEAYNILAQNMGNALTDNMICAGVPSGQRTTCYGDSGGPLMMRRSDGGWIQVGVVSWGRGPLGAEITCGHPSLYAVYARVSNYFNWIGTTIRSN